MKCRVVKGCASFNILLGLVVPLSDVLVCDGLQDVKKLIGEWC